MSTFKLRLCFLVVFTAFCSNGQSGEYDYTDELTEIQTRLDLIWEQNQYLIRPELQDTSNNTLNTYDVLRTTIASRLLDVFDAIANMDENAASSWSVWEDFFRSFETWLKGAMGSQTNLLSEISEQLEEIKNSPLQVAITNKVEIQNDGFAVGVTNKVTVTLDQQDENNGWLSHWRHDSWVQTQFLTNQLPALVSNLVNVAAASSPAAISNLVDSWTSIHGVPGWNMSGVDLSIEAWLSEWMANWNRSFYNQTPPANSGPPFVGDWTLLNWWGSAGSKPLSPSEVNARYSFADWIADAFRFFVINSSNMVVDSYRPYTVNELEQTGGLDWDTNIVSRGITPEEPEELFPEGSQEALDRMDAQLRETVSESLIVGGDSGHANDVQFSTAFTVGGMTVPEIHLALDNPKYQEIVTKIRSVMGIVWTLLAVVANVALLGRVWESLTQF